MGIFDWLTGNKSANADVPRLSAADLKHALLALNSDDKPWAVHDPVAANSGAAEKALIAAGVAHRPDLVADWKFSDERWRQHLADDRMSERFCVLLRFDDANNTVRSVDHDGATVVTSTGGSISAMRGQKMSSGGSLSFDRNAEGKWVRRGQSSISTEMIKSALRQRVADSGWAWHGVAFGKF